MCLLLTVLWWWVQTSKDRDVLLACLGLLLETVPCSSHSQALLILEVAILVLSKTDDLDVKMEGTMVLCSVLKDFATEVNTRTKAQVVQLALRGIQELFSHCEDGELLLSGLFALDKLVQLPFVPLKAIFEFLMPLLGHQCAAERSVKRVALQVAKKAHQRLWQSSAVAGVEDEVRIFGPQKVKGRGQPMFKGLGQVRLRDGCVMFA